MATGWSVFIQTTLINSWEIWTCNPKNLVQALLPLRYPAAYVNISCKNGNLKKFENNKLNTDRVAKTVYEIICYK